MIDTVLFFAVTLGRNQPLKKERPPWTSEIPLTEGQLRSKREEFWETAPAFEGRKEIWDALRAAAETDDHTWAQAIVDGANITLPTGERWEVVLIWSTARELKMYVERSLKSRKKYHSDEFFCPSRILCKFCRYSYESWNVSNRLI